MRTELKVAPRLLLVLLALLFVGLTGISLQAPPSFQSIAIKFALLLYLAYGAVSGRRSAAYILAALCAASAVLTTMQLLEEPLSPTVEETLLVGWVFVLVALAAYLVVSPAMRRLYASSRSLNAVAPPGP